MYGGQARSIAPITRSLSGPDPSFDLLFPRVRPGGLYVIEDLRWPPFSGLIGTVRRSDLPLDREAFGLRDHVRGLERAEGASPAGHFGIWSPRAPSQLTFGLTFGALARTPSLSGS